MAISYDHQMQGKYGQWTRKKVLGSGAFGSVTLWQNDKTKEEIAIKKLNMILNKTNSERWKNEVKIIKEAKHDNIVGYKKIPQALQQVFPESNSLGMEYCAMGDLRKFLQKPEHCCGLPEYLVKKMLSDISAAICYLNEKKSMHRDLKPENIVLKQLMDNPSVIQFKITDLGYAKDLNEHSCGKSYVGTMYYLAPEISTQAKDRLHYFYSVDFWSFGLLSFECITGYRPFGHNFDPGYTLQYIQRKEDKHIGIVLENTATAGTERNVEYISKLPEPNWLNKYLAQDLTEWLQSMLHLNPETRGGGSSKTWSFNLSKILNKKYISIVNTIDMRLMIYEIDDITSVQKVKSWIKMDTNIDHGDQLLLMENGLKPDVTKPALHSFYKPPSRETWYVYLFSTSQDSEYTNKKKQIPDILQKISDNSNQRNVSGKERMLLSCSYDFILKRFKWFQTVSAALKSLCSSVLKHIHTLVSTVNELNMEQLKTVTTFEIRKNQYWKNVSEYESLNEIYKVGDTDFSTLLQEAKLELDECNEILEINNVSKNAIKAHTSSQENLNSAKTLLNKYNDWNIQNMTKQYEANKLRFRKNTNLADQNQSDLAGFINNVKLINDDVNKILNEYQYSIKKLAICYNDVITSTYDVRSKIDSLKQIQPFPLQEAVQSGIWRMLRGVMDFINTCRDQVDNKDRSASEIINDLATQQEEIYSLFEDLMQNNSMDELHNAVQGSLEIVRIDPLQPQVMHSQNGTIGD